LHKLTQIPEIFHTLFANIFKYFKKGY